VSQLQKIGTRNASTKSFYDEKRPDYGSRLCLSIGSRRAHEAAANGTRVRSGRPTTPQQRAVSDSVFRESRYSGKTLGAASASQ
jgi:hypothetical protein